MGNHWHSQAGESAGERDPGSAYYGYDLDRYGLVAVLEKRDGPSYVTAVLRLQPAHIVCKVEEEMGSRKSWLLLEGWCERVFIGKDVAIKVADHLWQR